MVIETPLVIKISIHLVAFLLAWSWNLMRGSLKKILLLWCPGCFHSVGDADEGAVEGGKVGVSGQVHNVCP